MWQKERNGAFVQLQGVNGWSFSKEGVKNISSMFKLSGSQSVTLEQKQSQGKREKSKSTPGQGGLMHTNGFCHLWLGKIYDSAPQSCKQSTKQQTLAPYGILRQRNLKGEARPRRRRRPAAKNPHGGIFSSNRLGRMWHLKKAWVNNQPALSPPNC